MSRLSKFLFAAAFVGLAQVSQAQLLNTGLGDFNTSRESSDGPGQRVSVASNTTIGSFGFWIGTTGTVDMKFMIWDNSGANLLFSQVKTFTDVVNNSLRMTDAISFNLLAGQTYIFAIIGNGENRVSAFLNPTPFSQNGLTIVNPNSNFGPYNSPTYLGDAGATIALRINGVNTNVVPEPSTYAMMTAGLLAVFAVSRRKRSA